jgi:DNA polymerase III subunit delta'
MSNLDFFIKAKEKNRLTHLYLITGSIDVNKRDLAFEIANLILSDFDKREDLLNTIRDLKHSQVSFIKPDGLSIKKDQILELQKTFSKTSLVNAPRIYIIEDVDVISIQAANSLLKFMEEPENSNVYGILLTNNLQSVLPTITSRSQVVRVNASILNDIYETLINDEVDDFTARNISFLTSDFNLAKNYLDDPNIIEIINYIKEHMENIDNKKYQPLIRVNELLGNVLINKNIYVTFLDLLLSNYLDLLKYLIKEESYFNYKVGKSLTLGKVIKKTKYIKDEIRKQSANINISLSLDLLMVNLKK